MPHEMLVKPLPIYCPNREPDLEKIKAAKLALDLPFKVIPEQAREATTERILAIDVKPYWLCDYALVTDRTSSENLQAALRWVLTEEDHPRATTILDQLTSIFGPGTREIFPDELEAEERMRSYVNRTD